jgi:hypothetical protein
MRMGWLSGGAANYMPVSKVNEGRQPWRIGIDRIINGPNIRAPTIIFEKFPCISTSPFTPPPFPP